MSGRTSDDIRREIERKRAEMDQTVDALERKLSPGQLLDHALWMVRGSDTGTEKARAVGSALGGFAKDHPIPVALMSAGAAWLAVERGGDPDVGPGTYARADGRVGPYRGDALDEGSLRDSRGYSAEGYGDDEGITDRVRDKADDLKDRVSDVADSASDKMHSATDRLRDKGEAAKDRLQEAGDSARSRMHAMGDSARESAQAARERSAEMARRARMQARNRYNSTLDENPLALGAAAFGLGLAAGLSAPSTRWENEHMGDTADTLKGEAKSIAQDTARAARHAGADAIAVVRREAVPEGVVDELKGRAKRIASEAMDAAKETARAEGLGKNELQDRAKRIASDAANAARSTAREEGLTAEALKERAREAGEATREAARDEMA